ncbi:MAG: hypothetical protein OXN25_21515 [Candidatus Poribacteria bacterium]|nr:hypothetical protein [Candidatus Poribacteria bacterium]
MKIKENIKKSGIFWLPSFPGPVPGVLSVSNEERIVLEVAQSLLNNPASMVSPFIGLNDVFQVIGHIQEYGFIILDGCQVSTGGFNFNLSQIQTSQTIWAHRVFTGFPHIEYLQNGIPSFNTFKFSIEGIDEWVWIRGINVINAIYGHGGDATTISSKPPESISFNLTNGMQLKITFEMTGIDAPNPWKVGATQKTYFKLVSEDAQELDQFLSVAYKIVDLLCFTINETVHFDSMSATSNAIIQNHGGGITYPAPITIYDPSAYYYSKDQPKIDRTQMLFTFSDIRDNAEGMINKWIESYEDYQNAFELYFLAQLKPQLSWAVKFLTLAQGLEAYHRTSCDEKYMEDDEFKRIVKPFIKQFPKSGRNWFAARLQYANQLSLRTRIRRMFEAFNNYFSEEEKALLVAYIVDTRNHLTHPDPDPDSESKVAKGQDLYVLCMKMELLFELHFLKLTGFTPEKIQSIADNCRKLQWKRSLSLSSSQ